MDIDSDNIENYSDIEAPIVSQQDSFIDQDIPESVNRSHHELPFHQEQALVDYTEEDKNFTPEEQEEISKKLLFCTQELGSIETKGGRSVYIPGKFVESGLKDIVQMFKNENPEYPLVKYYLGCWKIMEKDLKSLVMTQRENKGLLYPVLTAMAFLTEPVDLEEIERFKYKAAYIENYDSAKAVFTDKEFVTILVKELSECIQKKGEERNKFENDMIELILTVFRNSLFFINSANARSKLGNELENVFTKIVEVYSGSGGVFDALVFISSNIDASTAKLSPILLEAFHLVISKVGVKEIFGNYDDQEAYKRLKEMEKYSTSKRRKDVLSARHSRFGAFIELRQRGRSKMLVSDPKLLKRARQGKSGSRVPNPINKVRPRITTKINKNKARNLKISLNVRLRDLLRTFLLDMLNYAFVPLIDNFYDFIYNLEDFNATANDIRMYVDFAGFGLGSAILLMKQGLECDWYTSAAQIMIVDFIFKKVFDCLGMKKTRIDFNLLDSCVKYFERLFEAVTQMGQSNNEKYIDNAKIIERALFSKDISKMIKMCFKCYLAYPNYKTNISLINLADFYFSLLGAFTHNKVVTIRTQTIRDDYIPEDEEEENVKQKITYREKRFNFLTELANFVDSEIIQTYVGFLREPLYLKASSQFRKSIFNLLKALIEDLEAAWYFYQIDILDVFYDFCRIENGFIIKEEIYNRTKGLIISVFGVFREVMESNSLLFVESLFRFESHLTLSNILTNYNTVNGLPNQLGANLNKLVISGKEGENWKTAEDLVLVKHFNDLRTDPDCLEKLAQIIQIKCEVFKETKEIAERIRILNLDNEPIENVEERIRKDGDGEWEKVIGKLKKQLKKQDNLAFKEKFFSFLNNQLTRFGLFINKHGQRSDSNFTILPLDREEAQLINFFESVLRLYGFLPPSAGYRYWRISSFASKEGLEQSLRKTKNLFESDKKRKTIVAEEIEGDEKIIVEEVSDSEEDENINLELSDSEDENGNTNIPIGNLGKRKDGKVNLFELITGKEGEAIQTNKPRKRLQKIKNLNK